MELNELIRAINIVDFISQFVDLEQRNDEWWGISPFTFPPERTPSFSVREDPPFFYDYSAGFGGNIFTFTQRYFDCSTHKVVDILKNYAGYDGDVSAPNGTLDAVRVFKQYAPSKSQVKQASKTILPNDYMEKYEKRYDKLKVWLDEGISEQSLTKFQVYYDSFSDRLVYPIKNMDGKIANVGGRALDPLWKEKGQSKYCYFYSWGTINTIYGVADNLEAIRRKKEVIIFEGCKSVLLADSWGIDNTGAILTSHLSKNQLVILAKLGCDVVFALDKDIKIRDDKNIKKLKQYVNVYYLWDRLNLLDDKDSPVDKGYEVFNKLYNNRIRYK